MEVGTQANYGNYEWYGVTYTESGQYSKFFETINGCDSIEYLNLTLLPPINDNIDVIACGKYEWEDSTYIESGVYTRVYETAGGYDSTVTMHLTINPLAVLTIDNYGMICGENEGCIEVRVESGNPPYIYSLSNGYASAPTAESQYTFRGVEAGSYIVQVTDSNGCEVESEEYAVIPEVDAIGEINTDVNLKVEVFPVPTADKLTIKSSEEISEYIIVDDSGNKIKRGKVQGTSITIDVKDIKTGHYFANIYIKGRTERVVKSIIVVRK
jgi:hypothetical protein